MKRDELDRRIIEMTSANPRYALEIMDCLNVGKRWFWQKVGLGSIYVACHRLEKQGYLRHYLAHPTPERKNLRRMYWVATGKRKADKKEEFKSS